MRFQDKSQALPVPTAMHMRNVLRQADATMQDLMRT